MIKGLDMKTPLPANTSSSDSPGQAFAMGLVLGIVALSVLLGCGAQPNAKNEQPETSARVTALAEPNKYLVELEWDPDSSAEKWLVHRRGTADSTLIQVGLLEPEATSFQDRSAASGETYTYFVSSLIGEKLAIRKQVTVTIPKDFLVEGIRSDIREVRGVNRLFLMRDAKILTGEAGLTIQVKEILSDSGTIETFPVERPAEYPASGRNAGPITIEAERAEGRLIVLNRGEGGARGSAGRPGGDGAAGARGNDGDFDTNPELIRRGHFSDWQLRGRKEAALRLSKDPNHPQWRESHWGVPMFACIRPPQDGGRGASGAPGEGGFSGTDGGNSARVLIAIATESPIVLDIANEPGAAGPGGDGGVGGTGGAGGTPGTLDLPRLCKPARTGSAGASGVDGKPGVSGKTGYREPVCTSVGPHKSEGCRHFTREGN